VQLTFWYNPADDLDSEVAFYSDALGLEEAWRDGDDTVAFWMPAHDVQVMVSTTPQPAGPMYAVDDVDAWIATHPAVPVTIQPYPIPGGSVAGLSGPGGNTFYVFDQPDPNGSA
jgi:predicted enzyme related to lactoylglutathione lyase